MIVSPIFERRVRSVMADMKYPMLFAFVFKFPSFFQYREIKSLRELRSDDSGLFVFGAVTKKAVVFIKSDVNVSAAARVITPFLTNALGVKSVEMRDWN